jgi:hypothetical protein
MSTLCPYKTVLEADTIFFSNIQKAPDHADLHFVINSKTVTGLLGPEEDGTLPLKFWYLFTS